MDSLVVEADKTDATGQARLDSSKVVDVKDKKPVVYVSEFVEGARIELVILQIGWFEFVEVDLVDDLESEMNFSFSSFLADIVFQFEPMIKKEFTVSIFLNNQIANFNLKSSLYNFVYNGSNSSCLNTPSSDSSSCWTPFEAK